MSAPLPIVPVALVCRTCQHFDPHFNECHAHPPTIIVRLDDHVESYWPNVKPTNWCSEWLRDGDYEAEEVVTP